jgi:uncharacterized membrane protein YkvA (DUF1232 family)
MAEADSSLDARYLDLFPGFLRALGDDARALAGVVASDAAPEARRYAVAALSYIFKSLDLIPDGIDDLGFLDDAFVLRVAASLASKETRTGDATIERLAGDVDAIRDFLGDVYPRLEGYVRGLRTGSARGRTVDEVLDDAGTRDTFLHEVSAWATAYEVPSFTRDVKTLIKLKAFLGAKL